MQLIKLHLTHWNFYCPVTGIKIFADGEMLQPSPALMGVWTEEGLAEGLDYIREPLNEAWHTFCATLDETDDLEANALNAFLEQFDAPTYVAFQINAGTASFNDTGWYVIDMNVYDE